MKVPAFFRKLGSENLTELERRTGVTRQALYNAQRTQNMKLDNLQTVAKALNFQVTFQPTTTEKNLLGSLVKFGVPVAHSGDGTLSLKETTSEVLKASRKDGAYESFVPYLLLRNVDNLDPLVLAAAAFLANEVNALGYFTEMAKAFRPHPHFELLLRLLTPAKRESMEFLVKETKSLFSELFMYNSHALKWNLKVRGVPEYHFERWRKWEVSRENS